MLEVAARRQSERTKRISGRAQLPIVALLLTGLGGIVLGWAIARVQRPESSPGTEGVSESSTRGPALAAGIESGPNAPSAAAYEALLQELEGERRAREALFAELEVLRADAPPESRIQGEPPAAAARTQRPATRGQRRAESKEPWFDRSALQAAGLSSSEIFEVEELWQTFEMEKLYLVDESKRDGTFNTSAYSQELTNLHRTFREDLCPEGYDAYLYATGRDNRVLVRQVLDNSPAADAGLRAGDIVVRYDGERIFHAGEFKQATGTGERGVAISLEVLRDGELYRFSVPRGPLGIRLGRLLRPPLRDR